MRYIALLRGINVGGNNKIPMSELKACFESLGYKNVSTYINSGNVLFDTQKTSLENLIKICEEGIDKSFGFHIIVSVIEASALSRAVKHAPSWWGSAEDTKHNAIFVIAPASAEEIMHEVGEAKPEYEMIEKYENIIFWSAPVKTFGRTGWSKIVGTKAYKNITIRNANTTRKLIELL